VREPKRRTSIALFVILLGCFLFVKNGFYVTSDIVSGRANKFDVEMNKRYVQMKSPGDTIYFNAIMHPPKSLPFYEVKEDPSHWFNLCWIRYFGREGDVVILKE
jgi:hypothetical protein